MQIQIVHTDSDSDQEMDGIKKGNNRNSMEMSQSELNILNKLGQQEAKEEEKNV